MKKMKLNNIPIVGCGSSYCQFQDITIWDAFSAVNLDATIFIIGSWHIPSLKLVR
jgi:hypothetical protein